MNYDPAVSGYDGNYLFYLDRWHRAFGYAVTAYLSYGERVTTTVKRLTIKEYDEHCIALERCTLEFAAARRNHDPEGEEVALSKAMAHELALLNEV